MKRVVIMGASSGIGLGVAEALASRGVPVGLAARHTKAFEALKKLYPDKIEYMAIDVTHRGAVKLLEELIEKLGGMDIYFHVAGIGTEDPQLDPEVEADVVRTNAEGFVRMVSGAYRWFRAHGKAGQIAAVTSVAGTTGIGRLAAYSAAKKFDQTYLVALEQLSNAEKAGITFTDIRPGWVETPLVVPGVEYPMIMTVDHVVPLIIKAIVRRKRVAYIDWRWDIVGRLWACVPNFLWVHMPLRISVPDMPLPTEQQYAEPPADDAPQVR